MTRVDFYLLEDDSPQGLTLFTCRLLEKALAHQHKVYVHCRDAAEAKRLDETLWTYKEERFLPHALLTDAEASDASTPIIIGYTGNGAHSDLLINLSGEIPKFFSRFKRVAELVPGDDSAREKSRTNFRYYRERGYPLHTHKMQASASQVRKASTEAAEPNATPSPPAHFDEGQQDDAAYANVLGRDDEAQHGQ